MAGLSHVFTAPTEACDNCAGQAEDHLIVTDTSPITAMLSDYVAKQPEKLASLEPRDVVPFLKENLRWRVLDVSYLLCS